MTQTITRMPAAELDGIMKQVSNWGRWGGEDELGALNLITPEVRRKAAATVQNGVAVSCALPLQKAAGPDNPNPVLHHVLQGGDDHGPGFGASLDWFSIAPHGTSTTHLDALCHVFFAGKMYNGFDQMEVGYGGAKKLSIMAGADGIVSRGVFLDIPALRGVPWLEPGTAITRAELEEAERRQQVQVEPGDILVIGTGRDARRAELGAPAANDPLAGLHVDCIPFLHERDVAVLGCDGITDARPSSVERYRMPFHHVCVVFMGVHLIDNMDVSRLSAACRERERWAFQLTVAPLKLPGGTGSPVNPIALF